jgi:DNA-binding IclR family transcriptional regulator
VDSGDRRFVQTAVKSAVRAFAVLELFELLRRPLALKEVSSELGYPTSSTSVLLKSLLDIGYLDYDRERRTYLPTMRLGMLGQWVQDSLFGDSQLLEAMEWLHQRTGEAVILAAQTDLHVQYLHILYSGRPLEFRALPGLRRSLGRSGLGWALLAVKPDHEIEQLRRKINAHTEEKLDREDLTARIAEVRMQGYSFSRHTISDGVGLLAMALPRAGFGRVFAFGVAGNVSGLERKEAEIVAYLRSAIASLSADMSEKA